MRFLQVCFLVMCFALTIWADIPPLRDYPQPSNTPTSEQKQKETGTCAGSLMLTIGVFLLGRWLIGRNNSGLQSQTNE